MEELEADLSTSRNIEVNRLVVCTPNKIIAISLVKIPPELKSFQETGEAVFSSSSFEWQTRDTFFYWVICFVNCLSLHRIKLDPSIRNSKEILIMYIHKSRETPVAIKKIKRP